MMANITFLSFLLFSMCKSIHGAVNTWINCSFYINIYNRPIDLHDVYSSPDKDRVIVVLVKLLFRHLA